LQGFGENKLKWFFLSVKAVLFILCICSYVTTRRRAKIFRFGKSFLPSTCKNRSGVYISNSHWGGVQSPRVLLKRCILPAKTAADDSPASDIKIDSPSASAPDQASPPIAQVKIDDSKAYASYANFCRVTGTPEELIIDFALNPQPINVPTEPLVISQRLVTNYYTAKRLLSALAVTVQRHEAAFGVLETNIQKRIVPQARST
jgi:hypothetical protein